MSASSAISSDITDFVVNQGHGVKGLVDIIGLDGILPAQYIQPADERFDKTKIILEESIPIIDVSNWDDPIVSESICNAAEKWGFFQIINHGVPIEVLEQVQNTAHRFFGLTTEEKRKYLKENAPTTTSSVFLGTSFSPGVEKVLEWKDFLSLLYIPGDDAPSASWPSVCKNEVLDYMKRCETVLEKLLNVLMRRLNVNHIDKAKEYQLMGAIKINMNYYPICPNPEMTAGVGRHSDISTLTILLQDDTGGLYVRGSQEDSWIHVEPINGSLVINVGDMLQILSNGRYKSIEHYVMANPSKNRVSVPIFVNPGSDAVIGPLPQVLENGEAPVYKQVLFSDYFKYFFSKGHDGKKTIEFAKI